MAFVDPYWLLGRAMEPTPAIVQSLQKAVGSDAQLERVCLVFRLRCLKVIGCSTKSEEPDPRIQRIVDDIVELRNLSNSRNDDNSPPSAESVAVLEATIAQWKAEVDVEELERTRLYIDSRLGLPRPVDSRLLFLGRTKLGRELRQGERVLLRKRFREMNRTIESTATVTQ